MSTQNSNTRQKKKKIGLLELAQEVLMCRTTVNTNKISNESEQFNCMYELKINKDLSELDQFNSGLQIGENRVQCFGIHFSGSLN